MINFSYFFHFVQFLSLCPICVFHIIQFSFTSSNLRSCDTGNPILLFSKTDHYLNNLAHINVLSIVLIWMDRFLKRSNPSSSTDVLPPAKKRMSAASKHGNISTKMHAAEYAPTTFIGLYCDAGRMFCKCCNVLGPKQTSRFRWKRCLNFRWKFTTAKNDVCFRKNCIQRKV